MMLLKCLLCGGYTKYLSMSNMWFSSGGTKSVLHNDDGENINCVLSGNKEFFMADRVCTVSRDCCQNMTLGQTSARHVQ